jgi:phosphoglycerol transferase MdoB-like AlkP superfamily enzyme
VIEFAICLSLALFGTLVLERYVQPISGSRALFHRISVLAAMPTLVYFVTIFMISYRPVFTAAATLITFTGIVVVNNAKYKALREPLVFSDFSLLRKAIEHPALYARHIGIANIVGVAVAATTAVTLATIFEHPVIRRTGLTDFFPMLAYLAVVLGMLYAVIRGPFRTIFSQYLRSWGPSTDVRQDVDNLSLTVCLVFYFFLANELPPAAKKKNTPAKPKPVARPAAAEAPKPAAAVFAPHVATGLAGKDLPSVVAVQIESFFDVRHLPMKLPASLLPQWDRVAGEAVFRGRLEVPAWGANTMRTEFAFLSGLPNAALGVHRFNPFMDLCKRPVWTLAHQLRALGYRTTCVHPFNATFFNRDKVYPNLGFDRFIDISAFAPSDKFGPYVGDMAVAEKVMRVVEDGQGPQFIFAITMENHGRWEPGRLDGFVDPSEIEDAPFGEREFALYLRHLKNSDAMVGRLAQAMRQRSGDFVLCAFGDHLPSLPTVFDRAGFDDGRSDYLVWRKGSRFPRQLDAGAEILGRLVLDVVLDEASHAISATSVVSG